MVVEPRGYRFAGDAGRSIMQAAIDAGYRWPTVCGGKAECAACFVRVLEGVERLSAPAAAETAALAPLVARFPDAGPGSLRLACQARPYGSVTVHKIGVRPDISGPRLRDGRREEGAGDHDGG